MKIEDYLNQGRTPIIRYRTPELLSDFAYGGLNFGNLYFYYMNTDTYYDSGGDIGYWYNFTSSVYGFDNYLYYYIIKVNRFN
jgi:hypothetical protein